MTQTRRERPAGSPGALPQVIAATSTSVWHSYDADYLAAWAAGYTAGHARGYEEGHADGYAHCDAELVAALTHALGGPHAKDYGDAVRIHALAVSRRQARAAADAPGWRPDDYRGGPVAWEVP